MSTVTALTVEQQLPTHITNIHAAMGKGDVQATIGALYSFGTLLREHYPTATAGSVVGEVSPFKENITPLYFTPTQFNVDLTAAIMDFRMRHGEDFDEDPYLNAMSWNITSAINCFYALVNLPQIDLSKMSNEERQQQLKASDKMLDVYDKDISAFIKEQTRYEQQEIADLVDNMQPVVEDFRQKMQATDSKPMKKILNNLIAGLERVGKEAAPKYKSLHQVREEYAKVFVASHHALSDTAKLSKPDLNLANNIRKAIIKAINVLVPRPSGHTMVDMFFYTAHNLIKVRLEAGHRRAEHQALTKMEAHQLLALGQITKAQQRIMPTAQMKPQQPAKETVNPQEKHEAPKDMPLHVALFK